MIMPKCLLRTTLISNKNMITIQKCEHTIFEIGLENNVISIHIHQKSDFNSMIFSSRIMVHFPWFSFLGKKLNLPGNPLPSTLISQSLVKNCEQYSSLKTKIKYCYVRKKMKCLSRLQIGMSFLVKHQKNRDIQYHSLKMNKLSLQVI